MINKTGGRNKLFKTRLSEVRQDERAGVQHLLKSLFWGKNSLQLRTQGSQYYDVGTEGTGCAIVMVRMLKNQGPQFPYVDCGGGGTTLVMML